MTRGIFKPQRTPDRSFHVTVHGVGDTNIFRCRQDMREFLARYRNYLSPQIYCNRARVPYVKLNQKVSLLGYCLLENHFHLFLHQKTEDGVAKLMANTQRAYARYYNDKYNRRGALFDARYAATPIVDHRHAKNTLGYVHLNHPIHQLDYEFSSHKLMTGEQPPNDWVDTNAALALFGGLDGYKAHLDQQGPALVADKLARWGIDPALHPYRPIV